MGFSSHDDLVNQITTNGKFLRHDTNKLIATAQVAGAWHDLGALAGYPTADATATNNYPGTSLTYVATTDTSTTPNSIYHGGNVSTATKHVLNVMAMCGPAAAGAPWILMLVDQLGYVRIQGASSADVTGTSPRTVTMTALGSGARYPYGEGSRLYFTSLVAPGGGGPNISALTYTNSNSTPATGKSMPYTVSMAAAAGVPVTAIAHTGNAANRYGPFLPLAAGDTGVADIEAFTLSGGSAYTGTSSVLVLHHVVPLLSLPVLASGVAAERDLVNQLPSMPRIRDGAHLKWLMFATGATSANSPFVASLDFGWGG
jgi:hypothetical protein